MIVKVVINGIDNFYECRRVFVDQDPPRNADLPDYVALHMESDDITLNINRRDNAQVYIMNDAGKTVEKYWFGVKA